MLDFEENLQEFIDGSESNDSIHEKSGFIINNEIQNAEGGLKLKLTHQEVPKQEENTVLRYGKVYRVSSHTSRKSPNCSMASSRISSYRQD